MRRRCASARLARRGFAYGSFPKTTWNLYAARAHFARMTSITATAEAVPTAHHGPKESLPALMLGAIGVVFGDIGTSPLYAMKESFIGPHPLAVDQPHIFGVLSLVFWTLMMVVTVKYVLVAMRADNKGEGGSFALLAMISRSRRGRQMDRRAGHARRAGDRAILSATRSSRPAISVLSAVEGLTVAEARLAPLILPISIGILVGLFLIQARGTAKVGLLFGPIILIYFATLAVLGVTNIVAHPGIFAALNPIWAVNSSRRSGQGVPRLGLGRAGRDRRRNALCRHGPFRAQGDRHHWLTLVYPCLMLCYLGQGALLLSNPEAVQNPFFYMAPEWARLPLVGIATVATIIASQAVISGAFSVTRQAVQLGFLPRLSILHTSAKAAGQIYIPIVNWTLLAWSSCWCSASAHRPSSPRPMASR